MVAICTNTWYCRDSEGQEKLSSKGLQNGTNADTLTYEAYHWILTTGNAAGSLINYVIRAGLGRHVFTYRQEQSILALHVP